MSKERRSVPVWRRGLLVLACGLASLAWSWPSKDDAQATQGLREFREGNFDRAAKAFERALQGEGDSHRLQYDLGTALLRSAMTRSQVEERNALLDRAITALRRAVHTNEKDLRERTLYNLGNALALRERFEESIASYRSVLLSNTKNEDARYNLELVLKAKQARDQISDAGGAKGQGKQGNAEGKASDAEGQDGAGSAEAPRGHAGSADGRSAEGEAAQSGAQDANAGAGRTSGNSVKAQTHYPDIGSEQKRSMDSLTLIQKLEALERRSGQLRRRGLLEKSRARLRDPRQKGTGQ